MQTSLLLILAAAAIEARLPRSPFPLVDDGSGPPEHLDNKVARHEQTIFSNGFSNGITEHWFEQRLDHGNQGSNETFGMRYWKSDRHYEPGGPVIALLGGETSGLDRLEFLDYGIVDILTRETHGLGIVIEHRYYGESIPVPDFTTENLKWLTTALALEDNVYFSRNVDLGFGNTTSSHVAPWIWYGGSYAGAQAAFLRHLYPEDVFGAIASSGVVHAQTNFWEYFEPIRNSMPTSCSKALISAVEYLDTTLLLKSQDTTKSVKEMFGLDELKDDRDFMNALALPLGYWQQQQWTEPNNQFLTFCDSLTKGTRQDESSATNLQLTLQNYAKYIKEKILTKCSSTVTSCFSSTSEVHSLYDVSQTWRLWQYQVCTEWGYHMPAPPPTHPSLISRLLTLEYVSSICQAGYQDSPHLIPDWPRTQNVNKYGDFAIGSGTGADAETHVMIVDGSDDPWLFATAHSPYSNLARPDSSTRPFKVIRGGFHHSDEYGVPKTSSSVHVPREIQEIHQQEINAVREWLKEF